MIYPAGTFDSAQSAFDYLDSTRIGMQSEIDIFPSSFHLLCYSRGFSTSF